MDSKFAMAEPAVSGPRPNEGFSDPIPADKVDCGSRIGFGSGSRASLRPTLLKSLKFLEQQLDIPLDQRIPEPEK